MPLKRRVDKKSPAVTPEAWQFPFTLGHDYFDTLAPLGLAEPHRLPLGSDAPALAQAEWESAIRDAWAEHGAEFMATWRPMDGQPLPWAAVAFGRPGAAGA